MNRPFRTKHDSWMIMISGAGYEPTFVHTGTGMVASLVYKILQEQTLCNE